MENIKINIVEDSITQEFGLKEIDKKMNYFTEEIKQHDSLSKKHKNIHVILNNTEHLFTLTSTVTGCVSFSALVL